MTALFSCVPTPHPDRRTLPSTDSHVFRLIVTTTIWFLWMVKTKFTLTPAVGFSMLSTYGTWLICQVRFNPILI